MSVDNEGRRVVVIVGYRMADRRGGMSNLCFTVGHEYLGHAVYTISICC